MWNLSGFHQPLGPSPSAAVCAECFTETGRWRTAGYEKGKAGGRQFLGKGGISLQGEAGSDKMGLGLMLLKYSGKSLFWILMTFEGETRQIPSGMRSDCCHGSQSAMNMGTQQRRSKQKHNEVVSLTPCLGLMLCEQREVAVPWIPKHEKAIKLLHTS